MLLEVLLGGAHQSNSRKLESDQRTGSALADMRDKKAHTLVVQID